MGQGSAYRKRSTLQLGVIQQFHVCEEGVHIDVYNNLAQVSLFLHLLELRYLDQGVEQRTRMLTHKLINNMFDVSYRLAVQSLGRARTSWSTY